MLGRAFYDNPPFIHMIPDDLERKKKLKYYFEFLIRYGILYGEVYATSPNLEGIAIWLPSGKVINTLRRLLRSRMVSLYIKVGWKAMNRTISYEQFNWLMYKRLTPLRHWYLAGIGVDPEFQGKGYGGILLKAMCKRVDQENLPIYLETDKVINLDFYKKHGFKVIEEEITPGIKLNMWYLIRSKISEHPVVERSDKPALQWSANMFMNLLIILVYYLSANFLYQNPQFSLIRFIIVVFITVLIFGARDLSMRLTAKACGLSMQYRQNENGVIASIFFALVTLSRIPNPKSIRPDLHGLSYQDSIKRLGQISFVGALVVLITSWVAFIIFCFTILPAEIEVLVEVIIIVGIGFAFYDIILAFPPFECYNGKEILYWNKYIWGILAIPTIILFIIRNILF